MSLRRSARLAGSLVTPTSMRALSAVTGGRAASMAFNAARAGYAAFRGYSKLKQSSGRGSVNANGGATTAVFPTTKKSFRKKRLSAKKKRFIKSVRRIIQGQSAYQQIIRQPHLNGATALLQSFLVNQQNTQCVSVWGINGTAGVHDDVSTFFADSYNATAGSIGPASAIDDAFMYVYNATVSLSVINRQTDNVADIDIYYLHCKRDVPLSMITAGNNDIGNFYNLCISGLGNTSIPITALPASTSPGVTPFTNPEFSKFFTVKSKQKIFLKPGESADVVKNLKKFKRVNGKDVQNAAGSNNLLAKAGLTEAFLIITNNVGWSASTANVTWYCTKRYKIKNQSGSQVPGIGIG